MKAMRFHQHGGLEVLQYEGAREPLTPGEVLVRVRACALNFLDVWERRGFEHLTIPMPHISGSDVAGEIVAVAASGTPDLAVGQRVMLLARAADAQRWLEASEHFGKTVLEV
jgi:NADPH:quinone reductase-like Zn-dependent oxidoreductase